MDLRQLLSATTDRAPIDVALAMGDRTWTYADLHVATEALAAGLLARGLTRGDRVVAVLGNSPDHVLLSLALAWAGLVEVPLNVRSAPGEIGYVVSDSGATMLVHDDPGLPEALHVAGVSLPGVSLVLAEPVADGPVLEEAANPSETVAAVTAAGAVDRRRAVPPSADDLACILYTSGTTGRPKAVPHTHRNVCARVQAWQIHFGPPAATPLRTLGTAPLFHITGSHCALWVTVAHGGTFWLPDDRSPAGTLRLMAERDITYLLGAPTVYDRWATAAAEEDLTLPSVELVVMGSAPRPPQLVDRLRTVFPRALLAEAYGNTEGVLLGSVDLVRRPGAFRSVGDQVTSVVRPGGPPADQAEEGEEGELIVSVECERVVDRYLGNAEATAAKFAEGWIRTGDAFRREADGTLWIGGRLDDVFISGGENIHPAEVEIVLSRHPGIDDVAVTGTPDPEWGDQCTAFVVRRSAEVTAADLDAFCRSAADLPDFKRPRRYVFTAAIPRNTLGKVVRAELRTRYANDQIEPEPVS